MAFFGIDVFASRLIGTEGSLVWFASVRVICGAGVLASLLAARKTRTLGRLYVAELCAFGFSCLGVSILSVRYGGLASPYIQGVSVIVVYNCAAVPDRFRRKFPVQFGYALLFPAVMAVASLVEPRIAAQWRTPTVLWLFVQNFSFVFATTAMGATGSHMVWFAYKQVFEARKLGRYRLKARIGVGGSGEVWLARDAEGKRDVALKILERAAALKPGARTRFEREARAATRLENPHTIRVFEFGASDDGVCFIAMELLDGNDLGTLLTTNKMLSSARVIHMGQQVCASLGEAHDKGVLHRDIKPENLFAVHRVDDPDFIKVLDFGLAKILNMDDDATVTHGAFVGGTPLYMAPEVCAGRQADARSDLYSLGAVLYHLVTGTPPLVAENIEALFRRHREDMPVPPSRHAAVSTELDSVIMRCLAKDPSKRFASARQLAAALESCGSDWLDGNTIRSAIVS